MKLSKENIIYIYFLYTFVLNLFAIKDFLYAIGPALLFVLLLYIFSKLPNILFKTVLSILLLLSSISIFFKWQYGAVITDDIVLSIFINKASLSLEMLNSSLIIWLIFTAIIPIILLFKIEITKGVSFKRLGVVSITLLLLISVWIKAIGFEFKKKGEIRDPKLALAVNNFSPDDTLLAIQKATKAYKRMKRQYSHIKELTSHYNYALKEENLTVVFVIGESSRGDHFSLNGYKRNTTPNLDKVDNLINFSNVTSCDTITGRSLPCLLSPLKMAQSSRVPTQGSFVKIFKKLGFYTSIYSLQGLNTLYNYMGYDKLVTKYAIIQKAKTGTKDMSLLPFAKEAIEDTKHANKLIILHTLGSHYNYQDRVAKSQEIFKPICKKSNIKSCTQQEVLNSYDNTIVAIDQFLNNLIKMLKDKKAILIYTSDHGESLGKSGVYFHGMPIDRAPKEQRDVPMMFWFSNSYKTSKNGKKLFSSIKKINPNAPLSHDYIFDSILGCSSIYSKNGGVDKKYNLCQER